MDTERIEKDLLKEWIDTISEAVDVMLQAVKVWSEGKADINGDWMVISCAKLNDIKLGLKSDLQQYER